MPNKLTDTEIVKALECCGIEEANCRNCIFNLQNNCRIFLEKEALECINRQKAEIEQLQTLVNEMSDYFPACIGCEGKTTLGERTDKCVYEIDNTNYCTKRGITNIVSIRNENRELKAEIERLKTKLDFAKAFRKETEAEFSLMHRKYGKALDIARANNVDKVVRCKDCKHYHKGKESTVYDYDYCDILYYCDGSHRTACEEDYCSYGKRSE